MTIYPRNRPSILFAPICFGCEFTMYVPVPSIIWEIKLFLLELTSKTIGDRHVLCKPGVGVLLG